MDVGRPIADLVPGPRGLLLATLVQLEKPVSVRALARHSGVSAQSALNLAGELSLAGLVDLERVGGSILVALNRDHVLIEPLYGVVRARGRLIDRISEELSAWPGLMAAWLFGSAARGDGDRFSDIDLLVVAEADTEDPVWESNVATLGDHVHAWTGNPVQITEHTRDSFARLDRDDNALVRAVRDDGIPLTPGSRASLRGAS